MEALSSRAGRPEREGAQGGALVFIGFMGAGKSSAASATARRLGVRAVDSDRELERELDEPIEALFDREGEAAFREREERVVLRLLEAARRPGPEAPAAVALGGGAVLSERVREALRHHTVVHLEVGPEEAWRRASGSRRPLARDRARFGELHRERSAIYESLADAAIPPGSGSPARALPALLALREAPPGARLVWAASRSGRYPVFAGPGLIRGGFLHPADGRRFVVTDENVARRHRVDGEDRITIMPGEEHKTIHGAELVLRGLAQAGAERGDLVLAVGGGVVGDLAGFCAAVYHRGMRHVQVPTTLVAQVDSAYGGKTGVDLPEGKNYVGAYHQPAAVLCDPEALGTLPREELAAGYAEVVKTALIAGGPLWARVRRGDEPDLEAIMGCLRTKLDVVAQDERDAGRRQVLNLGHTVGHAIEAATRYARYRHGEAVGIGLLVALRLSEREALRREVAELLRSRGLPLELSGASVDAVLALVERDKKRWRGPAEPSGLVPFVLVDGPGAVTPGHRVDPDALRAAVEEVHAG